MKQTISIDNKSDNFNGFNIYAQEWIFIDLDNNQKKKLIEWEIYNNGNLLLRDSKAIDGSNLNNISHAINDAKKNILTLERLKLLS